MHEYSLIESLLERIEREARDRGATGVRRVWVRIGEQSGVERDLFNSAFELCRTATICEQAELTIETVGVRWECRICGKSLASGDVLSCPDCGAAATLVAGNEIFLDRIELEVA